MEAYQGNLPYIFVSYSHKDRKFIEKVIAALQKNGYRVWFDEGIEVGTEWPQSIATRIKDCSIFLAFISNNSLASQNCTREINYAIKHRKEPVAIYMEDVYLSEGMDMQLSSIQSMYFNRFTTMDAFLAELVSTPVLSDCRDKPACRNKSDNSNTSESSKKNVNNVKKGKQHTSSTTNRLSTPKQDTPKAPQKTPVNFSLTSKIDNMQKYTVVSAISVIVTLLLCVGFAIFHFWVMKNHVIPDDPKTIVFSKMFSKYWIDLILGALLAVASFFTIRYVDNMTLSIFIGAVHIIVPALLFLIILPSSLTQSSNEFTFSAIYSSMVDYVKIAGSSAIRLSLPVIANWIICYYAIEY